MNLLEAIKQAFARLAELTADELTSLRADIVKCAKDYDSDDTVDNVEVLTTLADIGDAVKTRMGEIEQETAAAKEARDAARQRISGLNGDDEPEASAVADTEDTATAVAEAPEAVAASGKGSLRSTPARMARVTRSADAPPEVNSGRDRVIPLLAAGQLINHSFRDEITSRYDLAEEMCAKLDAMDRAGRGNGKQVIASARWADRYPSERVLSGDSSQEDFEKIDAVTNPLSLKKNPKFLAASGGVCLPTNVDYSMDVWATPARPLRDGLTAFAVDRGGLVYRQPPAVGTLAGATTVWTNANDIDPTDPTTKPVLAIECADPVQVFISAIPTRLGFGNLQGQFDPETISVNTDLAMAEAARIAELNLLTQIQTFSTSVTSAALFGASRTFFATVIQTTAAYRFTNRLNPDQVLTLVAPEWSKAMFKQDRVFEQAHDDAGTNVFAISDAEIEEWLSNYNIKVIWTLDGLTANAGHGTYAAQTFGAFTDGSAMPVWPSEIMFNIFIEGSIQFLDGGRLDLGVVRDATLDATNDYETFVEVFENVANRSFAGGVLQVVTTLVPNGSSSELVAY